MDTKKLRQKILDLAIRGKLVPQDPNDEPAIELLKRINPMFEPCNVEDCPFAIPPSWEWTTIGMSSKYKSASIDPSKYKDQDFELYSVPSFETGMPEVVKGSLISSFKKIVKEGDVLVCKINPHLNRIWVVEHHNKDMQCIASSEWIIFRNRDIDSQYLMRCFSSLYFLKLMLSNVSGVGGSLMRAQPASVEKYLFPLPPLAEQKRIANEVERWFSVIDELESNEDDLLKAIDKAKSKILDLAIHGKLVPQDPNDEPAIELLKRINPKFEPCDKEDYPTIPSRWQLCSVKDVFQINPKTNASDNLDAAFVPMSSIEDQYNNKFEFESRKWGEIKRGYTHFQDGDIAVAKISPCLENRKSVVLKDLPNGIGAGTTELNVFRSEIVNPIYGLIFFKSNYFISKCVGTFNGVVGQQRVATKLIEDIDFPLPPLAEQERIVAKIEEIFKALDALS